MSVNVMSSIESAGDPDTLYSGPPSQWINGLAAIRTAVLLGIIGAARVDLLGAWKVQLLLGAGVLLHFAYRVLWDQLMHYDITNERITVSTGVFSRETRSLELYRVTDVRCLLPWWQRLAGVGTIVVDTSEKTLSRCTLVGVPDAARFRDRLNLAALAARRRIGVAEMQVGRL